MPVSRAKQLAVLERRHRVAARYKQGVTLHRIATEEGVHAGQICRDLAAIRKEWRAAYVLDFGERQAEELAKIDHVEAKAWEAWERSCQPEEVMHAGTTKGRTDNTGKPLPALDKTYKTVRAQAGDPRFLERVTHCVERRCKMLGIDAPEKQQISGEIFYKAYGFDPITPTPEDQAALEADRATSGGTSPV